MGVVWVWVWVCVCGMCVSVRGMGQVNKACDKYILPIAAAESGCFVGVRKAGGKKCERCWFWSDTVHTHDGLDDVCPRCAHAVLSKGGL